MLYRSGMSVRKIRTTTNVHPQTLYRYVKQYIEEGQLDFFIRTNEETFLQLKQFMTQLERIMGWKK
jgi:transposase